MGLTRTAVNLQWLSVAANGFIYGKGSRNAVGVDAKIRTVIGMIHYRPDLNWQTDQTLLEIRTEKTIRNLRPWSAPATVKSYAYAQVTPSCAHPERSTGTAPVLTPS
ncbi:hypothetical protein [Hamadaea tsunoensis]|uniref:hypothetical protein n=1 Tax=Hamadaea tsunoensis TaxID=53368 RepID=UPI001B7F892E|nr:hypothetical protein [Hamadaea tsunoensis]